MADECRIAVVGDLHSAWDSLDVAYFNRSDYAMILFTGDLGGSTARDGRNIAKSLSGLRVPALVMPGNNDVELYAQIAAELTYRRGLTGLLGELGSTAPPPTRGGTRLCGYDASSVRFASAAVTIVTARPFAMGGSELSFPRALEQSYGVRSLEESIERMRRLVDSAETERLIFLAHNGPSGLGDAAAAPWGNDFRETASDWGDRDLEAVVSYARERGHRVDAVIAGHMHWRLRRGGERRWLVERAGTLFVNAARVPRIFERDATRLRHHIVLTVSGGGVAAKEVLVPDDEIEAE